MTQTAFAHALLDADAPVPPGLIDPQGRAAGKRFSVYRNTVTKSLIDALATGFPVVEKLVGAEFFRAMGAVFVRAHAPEDPRLQTWGGAFPGFLARFDPVAHLPYLPDIARLELGLRQSYHAADAAPLDLSATTPETLLTQKPRLAPATLVLSSRFPVLSIWRRNMDPAAPKPRAVAEDVLITRPGFDPAPHALPPGGLTLLRHLKGRLSLAEALTTLQTAEPEADVPAIMTAVLSSGGLTLDPNPLT